MPTASPTTQETAASADTVHLQLSLADLCDSPFNPRQAYPEAGIAELADSIRAVGRVLEPLLVRPNPHGPGYETVFGHRRARAATLAGLATVPCMVRAMSDQEAALAQMHENVQREDMAPLDEADGMAALVATHGLTAAQVAEQLGVSRRLVYTRLALAAMCEPARQALRAGRIGVETANAVARVVGPKAQEQALHLALERAAQDGRGYRDTVRELNDRFTLQLASAIFEPEDAALVPDAGPCSTCPKRSGNALELHGDVVEHEQARRHGTAHSSAPGVPTIWLTKAGPDVCTDPTCFAAKKAAHLAQVAAGLQAKGNSVVTGNAARQALSAHGEVKGNYVALKDVKAELRKLPPAERPQTVVIVDQRTGKPVQAVKRADLAGTSVATPAADTHERRAARSAAQAEQARQDLMHRTEECKAVWHAMRAVAQPDLAMLRDMVHIALDEACAYRAGLEEDLTVTLLGDTESALHAQIDLAGPADLTRLLLDMLLMRGLDSAAHDWKNGEARQFWARAQRLGVDADAVVAQVRAERAAPQTEADAEAAEGQTTPRPAARARKSAGKGAAKAGARYRCPDTGATWSGRGLQPAWLKAALAQGKTLAHFDTTADATALFLAQHGAAKGKKNSLTKPAEAGERAPSTADESAHETTPAGA